jgi:two-component system, response regulator PdtaR
VSGPLRVVIADDEAIIRLDLKELLTSAGYEVVGEASNGIDAAAAIERERPDLAILDVKMPGEDGVEVARRVAGGKTSVILLTAFSQRHLIESARDAGVAAYLVKPFRSPELLRVVEEVVAGEVPVRATAEAAAHDAVADDKIETRRVVDEAKEALMQECGLDEPTAFEFIQRTAMSQRVRMRDVATSILDGSLRP